ncbi:MAG: 16S rRNA (cytidine(1402)-2'-O)-methyltransferase [Rickettsiaceae bacterium]|nr:MAG: 16S rRNA (cytidine(1402)-2'-O)-methyltransferase [Rickettsiaceae bacterium]
MDKKAGLYIVSTPIGNFKDITLRAIETLKESDMIFCEDTRISKILLAKHNINTQLQVYNDHSSEEERNKISNFIDLGMKISLISDAGTPLISDPGYKLVRELKRKNYYVEVIPGVSSLITALTISQLPSDSFFFAGFLPKTIHKKKKIFQQLTSLEATLVFFDTAPRLIESLQIAMDVYGDREACVARELTKIYQETKFNILSEIIKFYQHNSPRGEIVILISGKPAQLTQEHMADDVKNYIIICLAQNLSIKDTAQKAYEKFNAYYLKKELYKIANNLKSNI